MKKIFINFYFEDLNFFFFFECEFNLAYSPWSLYRRNKCTKK